MMSMSVKIAAAIIGIGGTALGIAALVPTKSESMQLSPQSTEVQFIKGDETIVCPSIGDASVIMNMTEEQIQEAMQTGETVEGFNVERVH